MAFFALLWKARTIENYRLKYEKEKINSIMLGNAQLEQSLSQRWRHYRFDTKKRISRIFKKLYPDGSAVSNFFLYLMTDQTFPNFLLKSVMGFVGGIILTYLCFMFFVFQLAISLIHATIMSSIIGVLLTLGLAFSYRIRCLVFLLIPQFFSRVGRYTLTCYALVLILTGPATNTLKNSEVLSESMACTQEQIKTSVHQLNDLMKKPINAMKDSIKQMVDHLKRITAKVKKTVIRLDRLVLSIVHVIQSSFSWLQSVADICNAKLGSPYDRCYNSIQEGYTHCQKSLGPQFSGLCNIANVAQAACHSMKPFKAFCYATDFMDEAILASVRKKLRNFNEHLRAMFHVEVHMHHSYSYSSNTSRSASQVAAGIVTEIRNRADPLLTWLSWSSCVTSLFLLLIIFRAKYYQHMYETRSRFDNRYVTKELQELDLKRQQQGRQTILPLNRRERAKYITTSSFRLVASEKVYLNRSAVFMAITTFKLLIHMVADYSLYWVLMTIRCHGRFQSDLMPGIPHSGAHVTGDGFVARLFSSIIGILDIPLTFPASAPIACLPDPYPPDLRRYTQIGVLIFLLWFFALFEPYGLRLRHLIMGHYRPERAKARATWLYNHILRTRGSFMKFARRKLHREYKYSSEASLTFRQWVTNCVPCQTPGCPGVFCMSCFTDIGELCTICLSPADYGDLSDVSLEQGSSDDDDNDFGFSEGRMNEQITLHSITESDRTINSTRSNDDNQRSTFFSEAMGPTCPLDTIALVHNERTFITNFFQQRFRNMQRNMKKRCRVKKRTLNWVAKVTPENKFSKEESHNYYSNSVNIEENGFDNELTNRSKSIGINTDRNRGVLLSRLINRFTRRRLKQPRIKLKKYNLELEDNNKKIYQQRIHRKKKHTNLASSRKTFSIKSFNTYDLTLLQRNLMNIVRSKKERNKTKDKMKGCKELKGIMKAIRYFRKSNEIKNNMLNQNNDASNDSLIENRQKITEPTDNTNIGGRKSKKKTSKANKPKKPKKQKDAKKIKTKNSRQRIAVFHKFFSNHWNNFKCSIIPGYQQNRSDIPIPKQKKNHKRRKKRKLGVELNDPDIDECFGRKDIKETRNLRINAYLAELEWTKRNYRKDEDIDEENNSFSCAPAPVTANKIVGMVHLKNLPFQWREARKREFYDSKHKKICAKTESSTRLYIPLSKQKLYAKKALNRFRNKVNTVPETPRSSLVRRLLRNISGVRDDCSFNRDSSICISKRANVCQSYGDSDILDMEMLYQNKKFDVTLAQDTSESKPSFPSNLTEERSNLPSFLGKEIVISYSSTDEKCGTGVHCRCDFYEDLQRKWEHVKKSIAEFPGTRNPLSLVKNFCSSLFGRPSCNVETCPNRPEKNEDNWRGTNKKNKNKSSISEASFVKKSTAVQTSGQKNKQIEIQMSAEEGAGNKTKQKGEENKGIQIHIKPHKDKGTGSGPLLGLDNRDVGIQYVKQDFSPSKVTKGVGSVVCICDEAAQICSGNSICLNSPHMYCTCATQDSGEITQLGMKYRDKIPIKQEVATLSPVANKKTQYEFAEESFQAIHDLTTESPKDNKNTQYICAGESFQPINEITTVSPLANKRTQYFCAGESFQTINEVTTISSLANNRTQYLCAGESFQAINELTPVSPVVNKKTQCKCAGESFQAINDLTPLSPVVNKKTQCKCAEESFQAINEVFNKKTQCKCARESFQAMNEVTTVSRVVNKKIQHYGAEMADKATHCTARKHYKKCKDMKSGVSMMDRKLSLGSSFLLGLGSKAAQALKEELTSDTITDTSISSSSLRSDESKTDTTICSVATFNRNDPPKRRKFRVKVVTKANQSTLTDTTRVCDTGTATHDWWSPMIERKRNDEILLEKKKGLNIIDKETQHLREQKELKELKEVKKRMKNSGVSTEARNVSFRSKAQIIPSDLLPTRDIMSPSRYLLESQKYYNELYAYNSRRAPQVYNYITQMPKYLEKEKSRSPAGSRRNHLHKTKRLDECYSPRKQLSPRKRKTDSTRTSDSPRRKPTHRQHDRQSTNRHHTKNDSPRKRV